MKILNFVKALNITRFSNGGRNSCLWNGFWTGDVMKNCSFDSRDTVFRKVDARSSLLTGALMEEVLERNSRDDRR